MVVAAIKSLNEAKGSTPSSIKNYISQNYNIELSTNIDHKSGNKQSVEKLIDNILKNGVKKQVLEEDSGLYKINKRNKVENSNKNSNENDDNGVIEAKVTNIDNNTGKCNGENKTTKSYPDKFPVDKLVLAAVRSLSSVKDGCT